MSCCRSRPRCRSCPVLLALRARKRAPRHERTSLFDEIYNRSARPLPASVQDALLGLSPARERYRHEIAAARPAMPDAARA